MGYVDLSGAPVIDEIKVNTYNKDSAPIRVAGALTGASIGVNLNSYELGAVLANAAEGYTITDDDAECFSVTSGESTTLTVAVKDNTVVLDKAIVNTTTTVTTKDQLRAALDGASTDPNNPTKIVLGGNIDEKTTTSSGVENPLFTVKANTYVILDLNGYTIKHTDSESTVYAQPAIKNSGTLTIINDSDTAGGIESNEKAILNAGTLTVNGDSVTDIVLTGTANQGLEVANSSVTVINGATIKGGYAAICDVSENTANVTISNASLIRGTDGNQGSGFVVQSYNSNGGTYKFLGDNITMSNQRSGDNGADKLIKYGEGGVTLAGGGRLEFAETSTTNVYQVVQKAEPTTSAQLKEAIEAGISPIVLTGDITLDSALTIAVGSDITIDLNGYTLTGPNGGPAVVNNGTLTVTDSSANNTGAIVGQGQDGTGISNAATGKLTADGANVYGGGENFSGSNASGIYNYTGGKVTVSGTAKIAGTTCAISAEAKGNGTVSIAETVQLKNSTGTNILSKVTLPEGKTLVDTDGDGWYQIGDATVPGEDDFVKYENGVVTFKDTMAATYRYDIFFYAGDKNSENWESTTYPSGNLSENGISLTQIFGVKANWNANGTTSSATSGGVTDQTCVENRDGSKTYSATLTMKDLVPNNAISGVNYDALNETNKYLWVCFAACANGSTTDNAWFYLGEFTSLAEVVGEVEINSKEELIAAASNPMITEIKLSSSFNLDSTLTIHDGKEFTIDLNGQTLTCAGGTSNGIKNLGTLIITDSSATGAGKITNSGDNAATIQNCGALIVENGTIESTGTGNAKAINLPATIGGSGSDKNNPANGTVTVNGGSVVATNGTGIINDSSLNDGTAQVIINGGEVKGATNGIWNYDGTTKTVINGGDVIGTDGPAVNNGGTVIVGDAQNNTININGKTTGILGGTVTVDGTNTTIWGGTTGIAADDLTVDDCKSISGGTNGIVVESGDTATINGGTIHNTVTNNGTLNMTNATVSVTTGNGINNNGALTVTGSTVTAANGSGIYTGYNATETNVNGGSVSGNVGIKTTGGKVVLNNATVTGVNAAIEDTAGNKNNSISGTSKLERTANGNGGYVMTGNGNGTWNIAEGVVLERSGATADNLIQPLDTNSGVTLDPQRAFEQVDSNTYKVVEKKEYTVSSQEELQNAIEKGAEKIILNGDITLTDTLNISGKVEITSAEGKDYTIKRGESFTGTMFTVPTGGDLTLTDVTVDGGATWSGDDPATRTNSGVKADGQIIEISGGTVTLGDGATLQNNDRINNSQSGADHGSAVYVASGTFNMTDGAAIKDNAVHSNNGTVTGDGAAVSIAGCTSATISGEITGNYSGRMGGAIRVYQGVGNKVTIKDAEITNNVTGNSGHGAVDLGDSVALEGKVVINNNTNSIDNVEENVTFYNSGVLTEGTTELAAGSSIGVTAANGATIGTGFDSGDEAYFFADGGALIVENDNGSLKLTAINTPEALQKALASGVKDITLADGFTGDITVPDGVSIKLAGTMNGNITVADGANVNIDLNGGTLNGTITTGKNSITVLDLNGGTVNNASGVGITNNGTLTVKDSSTAKNGTVSGKNHGIVNHGTLTVEAGNITGRGNEGIHNQSDAVSVAITGGTITGKYAAICDYDTNGTVTIGEDVTLVRNGSGNGYVINSYGSGNGGTYTIANGVEMQNTVAGKWVNTSADGTAAKKPQVAVSDYDEMLFDTNGSGPYTATVDKKAENATMTKATLTDGVLSLINSDATSVEFYAAPAGTAASTAQTAPASPVTIGTGAVSGSSVDLDTVTGDTDALGGNNNVLWAKVGEEWFCLGEYSSWNTAARAEDPSAAKEEVADAIEKMNLPTSGSMSATTLKNAINNINVPDPASETFELDLAKTNAKLDTIQSAALKAAEINGNTALSADEKEALLAQLQTAMNAALSAIDSAGDTAAAELATEKLAAKSDVIAEAAKALADIEGLKSPNGNLSEAQVAAAKDKITGTDGALAGAIGNIGNATSGNVANAAQSGISAVEGVVTAAKALDTAIGTAKADIDSKKQALTSSIESNDNLTAEDKEALVEQINAAVQAANDAIASAADANAVTAAKTVYDNAIILNTAKANTLADINSDAKSANETISATQYLTDGDIAALSSAVTSAASTARENILNATGTDAVTSAQSAFQSTKNDVAAKTAAMASVREAAEKKTVAVKANTTLTDAEIEALVTAVNNAANTANQSILENSDNINTAQETFASALTLVEEKVNAIEAIASSETSNKGKIDALTGDGGLTQEEKGEWKNQITSAANTARESIIGADNSDAVTTVKQNGLGAIDLVTAKASAVNTVMVDAAAKTTAIAQLVTDGKLTADEAKVYTDAIYTAVATAKATINGATVENADTVIANAQTTAAAKIALEGDKAEALAEINVDAKAKKADIDALPGLSETDKTNAKAKIDAAVAATKTAIDNATNSTEVGTEKTSGTTTLGEIAKTAKELSDAKVEAKAAVEKLATDRINAINASALSAEDKATLIEMVNAEKEANLEAIVNAPDVAGVALAKTKAEAKDEILSEAMDAYLDMDGTAGLTAEQKAAAKENIKSVVNTTLDNIDNAANADAVVNAKWAGTGNITKAVVTAALGTLDAETGAEIDKIITDLLAEINAANGNADKIQLAKDRANAKIDAIKQNAASIAEINSLVKSGKLDADDAAALIERANTIKAATVELVNAAETADALTLAESKGAAMTEVLGKAIDEYVELNASVLTPANKANAKNTVLGYVDAGIVDIKGAEASSLDSMTDGIMNTIALVSDKAIASQIVTNDADAARATINGTKNLSGTDKANLIAKIDAAKAIADEAIKNATTAEAVTLAVVKMQSKDALIVNEAAAYADINGLSYSASQKNALKNSVNEASNTAIAKIESAVDADAVLVAKENGAAAIFVKAYLTGTNGKLYTSGSASNYDQLKSANDNWNKLTASEKAIVNTVISGASARRLSYTDLLRQAELAYMLMFMPNYYKLTFDTNGGTAVSSVTKVSGTTVDLSKYTTTREGYEFNGWYSDAKLTKKITSIRVTKNVTVYAGWTKIEEAEPIEPVVNPFKDIFEKDWYYEDVLYVFENGLMNGTEIDEFGPEVTTTRGMIVTILWRLEGEPIVNYDGELTDVPENMYYAPAVDWAAANGILTGYGDGKFGPEDPITREQMVTILWRYAKYKGVDVSSGKDTDISGYKDNTTVSDYAVEAMKWAVAEGIIKGDNNALTPTATAPRSQIAAILHRYCLLIEEE